MATCAELAANLAEAEAALHNRLIGKAVELVRAGEKQIDWASIDIDALRKYVADLQRKVDACNGVRRPGRLLGTIPVDSNC